MVRRGRSIIVFKELKALRRRIEELESRQKTRETRIVA
jgi:hypothetical protein